ncbi:unnamed protein product [Pylaiella littoralis]
MLEGTAIVACTWGPWEPCSLTGLKEFGGRFPIEFCPVALTNASCTSPTFERFEQLLKILRAAGVRNREATIFQTTNITRQLPDFDDVEKSSSLAADSLTRGRVKGIIRSSCTGCQAI